MEIIMKEIIFKNIFNNDQVRCKNVNDTKTIDGVEYLKVITNNNREMLMRKDALKKVTKS